MAGIITWTPHGVKTAVISDHKRQPGDRGQIKGWSQGAARRNRDFLQSIDPSRLDGIPVAYTLTLRDCPPSAEAMAKLVKAFRLKLFREGAIRDHWVIEWQKRGVPHLHGMVYFDADTLARKFPLGFWAGWQDSPAADEGRQSLASFAAKKLPGWWLKLARVYNPGPKGQHAEGMTGLSGWLAYLTKHASRGVEHYQRQRDFLPAGWQTSGRLWGKGGDWPTLIHRFRFDDQSRIRLRRALRRLGRARAITEINLGLRYGNMHQVASGRAQLAYFTRSGVSDGETPEEKRKWSWLRGSNVFVDGLTGQSLIEWAIDHDASTVDHGETYRDSRP